MPGGCRRGGHDAAPAPGAGARLVLSLCHVAPYRAGYGSAGCGTRAGSRRGFPRSLKRRARNAGRLQCRWPAHSSVTIVLDLPQGHDQPDNHANRIPATMITSADWPATWQTGHRSRPRSCCRSRAAGRTAMASRARRGRRARCGQSFSGGRSSASVSMNSFTNIGCMMSLPDRRRPWVPGPLSSESPQWACSLRLADQPDSC